MCRPSYAPSARSAMVTRPLMLSIERLSRRAVNPSRSSRAIWSAKLSIVAKTSGRPRMTLRVADGVSKWATSPGIPRIEYAHASGTIRIAPSRSYRLPCAGATIRGAASRGDGVKGKGERGDADVEPQPHEERFKEKSREERKRREPFCGHHQGVHADRQPHAGRERDQDSREAEVLTRQRAGKGLRPDDRP